MKLQQPFIISARLLPALRVADATLHLESVCRASGEEPGSRILGHRSAAGFILEFADGTEYRDASMQSGCGGFDGLVEAFESFLSFLSAAGESLAFQERTGIPGDNADLFPTHVTAWARENLDAITLAQSELQDENGHTRQELIES